MYLIKEWRPAEKHVQRAQEGIHLGVATDSNTSGYVIHFPSTKKMLVTNQKRFDELLFLYRKQNFVKK
jgi:hypothetical protein